MKVFSAKLLLFGEYGLMFGAKALTVPFSRYRGELVKTGSFPSARAEKESHSELEQFASWLKHERVNEKLNFPLDLEWLSRDIAEGAIFRSDVPFQYGVGSSGALCAALYHEYSSYNQSVGREKRKHSLPELLQHDFAVMESYFHGRSSGLDPLVSFLNQPVLLENERLLLPNLHLDKLPWKMYLIDTGISSATSPLVRIFLNKMEDRLFEERFRETYLPANDGAVDAFINLEPEKLFDNLCRITRFQLEHFVEMIPLPFIDQIPRYLEQNIFVKLLGSGGGGYLLAFVPQDVSFPESGNCFRVF